MIAKNIIKNPTDEEIDDFVTEQAKNDSAWEEPIQVKPSPKSTQKVGSVKPKQGQVALLLEPEDLKWLAQKLDYPTDTARQEKESSARIRLQVLVALQKAGLIEDLKEKEI